MWRRSLLGAVNRPFVSASEAFDLSWVGQNTSATDASVYTYTAQGIGTASAGRRVLFGVAGRVSNTPQTVTATLGGNAATSLVSAANPSGNPSTVVNLFYRDEPTGTTADIVATFSTTMLRSVVDVARLAGYSGSPSTDSVYASGTSTTITLTVPSGGAGYVFCYASNGVSLSLSGTGVTQNAQQALEFGFSRSAILTTAGSITVTATGGSAGDLCMVGVAYGP